MPAYKYYIGKDKNTVRWLAKFYITDSLGKSKACKKEGFLRERDAKAYEREYLAKYNHTSDMPFQALYKIYMDDISHRLKEVTVITKQGIFKNHILPYFAETKLSNITVFAVREWQNQLLKKDLSPTYLRSCHNHLAIIFNYAMKMFRYPENPATLAGSIGSKKPAKEMSIWTLDEYKYFSNVAELTQEYQLLFDILFWTGMRIGELLALTWADLDLDKGFVGINKTYKRMNKKDVITTPKTEKSNRKVAIPGWLVADIESHKSTLYETHMADRVFDKGHHSVSDMFRLRCVDNDIPRIRLHDLRHSHASLLIHENVNPLAISRRLGHENVQTTLDVYGHLYPNAEEKIIEMLGILRGTD